MIIGNFNKQAKGYAGDLITLTHQAKLVFTPASKGVDYEVTLDGIKLGAAWKKTISPGRITCLISISLHALA
jgi:uncharacterized protein (DUF736 family)